MPCSATARWRNRANSKRWRRVTRRCSNSIVSRIGPAPWRRCAGAANSVPSSASSTISTSRGSPISKPIRRGRPGTESSSPPQSRNAHSPMAFAEAPPPRAGPMAKQQTTPEALPLFARFARAIERQVGRSSTFVLAIGIVLVWAASGPLFHWSDTWQLVINTGTTIITFLMVFVIQNTQSRDTMALHLKLDELIRVTAKARDELVGAEDLSDKDIVEAREAVHELAVAE